jgi:hypothetical protein
MSIIAYSTGSGLDDNWERVGFALGVLLYLVYHLADSAVKRCGADERARVVA